ncbi:aspartate/glutamate racemase family protein [Catenuloplanes sp. NPDC051500]|uniref:aspartate/glutamate racemase family protein n=1 Tax=Catenuloplanes sp. NPDC051500 TaxID=3363959 RepID=UPI0037B4EA8B
MLIKVINPNTTDAMTATIESSARAAAGPGTLIEAITPVMGPASIESHYDEALSVPGLLHTITSTEPADAYVIACFGDPGLDAAREIAPGPVIGIAEAAMHLAMMLGRGFSVITTLSRTRGRAWDLAARYCPPRACLGVHATDIPVLDLSPSSLKSVVALARHALDHDGSDAIVLGCAGMADLCAAATAELGVPVIDGVAAAVGLAETLVRLGLSTSTRDEYAFPPPKTYRGPLAGFAR